MARQLDIQHGYYFFVVHPVRKRSRAYGCSLHARDVAQKCQGKVYKLTGNALATRGYELLALHRVDMGWAELLYDFSAHVGPEPCGTCSNCRGITGEDVDFVCIYTLPG